MNTSRYVMRTHGQSVRPQFGEIKLEINPDKQTHKFTVSSTKDTRPGRGGSKLGHTSVPETKQKNQITYGVLNRTKPVRPIQDSSNNIEEYRTVHGIITDVSSDRPSRANSTENCKPLQSSGSKSEYKRFSPILQRGCVRKEVDTRENRLVPCDQRSKHISSPTTATGYRTPLKSTTSKCNPRVSGPAQLPWQLGKGSKMADRKFIEEVVNAHNNYRANHQVDRLVHSPELSDVAQRWADHLAKLNTFHHSDSGHRGKGTGENIAMKWTSGPDNYSGQEVTDQWYGEIKMYKFGAEPSNTGTGHFTQVVWKDSKEIGVGKAKTADGKILVVANYRPAGNMMGSYRNNVLPPKDGKVVLPVLKDSTVAGYQPKQSKGSGPFSSRFENNSSNMASHCGESRSVRTFTETTGSGPNKVTKTVVEETIIKADGSKTTNRKETITTGDSGASGMKSIDHHQSKDKDKDKKGGAFGDDIPIEDLRVSDKDFFKKDKKGKRSSSSSSDSSPEREKKPQKLKDFIDEAVKTHNNLRKKHGVEPLKHAKDLSEFAQKWAEHLAATNSFQHSDCQHSTGRLGENIACKWSSSGADYSGKDVTEYWYSEIEKHDFSKEPRSLGSGHFTQVVWKGTKEMGIGKAKTSGGKVLVVASYRPAGNMVGSFVANVLPVKK